MKYDWIQIAIKNGGSLKALDSNGGITAEMSWTGNQFLAPHTIFGDPHTTLPDALASLNFALEDDAADECEC